MTREEWFKMRGCVTLAKEFAAKGSQEMMDCELPYTKVRFMVQQLWAMDALFSSILAQFDNIQPTFTESE